MKLMVLGQEDIKKVFTMKDAIQADKDAMATWSKGESMVPLRITFPVEKYEGLSQYMPAYDPEAEAVGVKIVATYPKNVDKGLPSIPAVVVMVDAETGFPNALIDGTYLTRVRTGAVSGAATDVLAKKVCRKFALFGTGGQAESQLEAVLTARPMIEEVFVYDLNAERQQSFIKRMEAALGGRFSAKLIAAQSAEEAVRGADIVTTVTTSPKPVLCGEWLKKGVHINAVGYSNPQGRELDEATVLAADKLYVDTRDGALKEVGDLLIPMTEGKIKEENVYELGEVLNKTAVGRTNDEEITLFKTVGFGGLDVVTGKRIIDRAKENPDCRYIEL